MKRMRRKFRQQQKKRAEESGNWQGDLYDAEKGHSKKYRISKVMEDGVEELNKKMKPKRYDKRKKHQR